MLIDKKGVAIISSHRVYGHNAGPEMSAWLKDHGKSMEKELMAWELGVPVLNGLVKDEDKQLPGSQPAP